MNTLSIRAQIILGVGTIAGVMLLGLLLITFNLFSSILENNMQRRALIVPQLFASSVVHATLEHEQDTLDNTIAQLMKNTDIAYIRVTNPAGALIAQSDSAERLAFPRSVDTTLAKVKDGIFDTTLSLFRPDGQQQIGALWIGFATNHLEKTYAGLRNWLGLVVAIELLLLTFCAFLFGNYISSNLRKLLLGIRKIKSSLSTSQYEQAKLPVYDKSDIGKLAQAFNELIDTLKYEHEIRQQAEHKLVELNASLEQKVAERTHQLSEKNDALRQANADLKAAQSQLLHAEKMASIGQLAAGIAHEVNNPVGFVGSNLNTLKDYLSYYQIVFTSMSKLFDAVDDTERARLIEEIKVMAEMHDLDYINKDIENLINESKDGITHISEIVKGLRLFSRVDTEDKQLSDINQVIRTTLTMVNNKLKYHCDVDVTLGAIEPVLMNVSQISQILTNLLLNAAHAIEVTGRHGQIVVRSEQRANQVLVSVADNGCGITNEDMDKLFTPFFTTKPAGEGTGLGLSIAYGIAQDHGGNLVVESTPNKGSCFTLLLPLMGAQSGVDDER